MTQPNPSTALARALVDQLVRSGVRFVVISPGSRSAALAIAAQGHPRMSDWVALDERSAGYQALGWCKATGEPAAVISTSGTAPANYLPAVSEADMSLAPLLVVSADRPSELRGVYANQTIDQVQLFGSKVRWFVDVPPPEPGEDLNRSWRRVVAEAVGHAVGAGGLPGPVHINVGFREPTVPVTDDGRSVAEEYPFSIEPDDDPGLPEIPPPPRQSLPLLGPMRGVVVAGDGEYDRQGLIAQATRLGWPVLATAMSGLRAEEVVTHYHHILAVGPPQFLIPEVVVAVGTIGPSQRLERFIGQAQNRIRIDRWGRTIDPERNATHLLHADPVASLASLEKSVGDEWHKSWLEVDRVVGENIENMVHSGGQMTGASAVRGVDRVPWSTLVVASSLPVREVDAHLMRGGRVIANRGASGIDGFVSTAIGVARAADRTVAVSGDLSLLHDSSGFLVDQLPDLVVVVLDNDGGGIFDSLPPARHAPDYERLFVAPHGRDLSQLARLHQLGYLSVGSVEDLTTAVTERLAGGGTHLVRVPIDRKVDLEQRAALDEMASEVVRSLDI